jgi:protein SCO1/2
MTPPTLSSALPARSAAALMLLLTLLARPALAHEPHHDGHHQGSGAHDQHGDGMPAEVRLEGADVTLLDLPLLDTDGRARRFRSELVGDAIVAMDFVYTSCTTICPILSTIFAEVQDRLGERVGNGVTLLSLSVDPMTDVPARLKRYAANFEARQGWEFLTGEKSKMDQVLIGLGAYAPDFDQHAPSILIGDARSGTWRRLYGFPSPERIVAVIDEFAADRGS